MSGEKIRSNADAFAFLVDLAGKAALLQVAAWMVLASATEGIGLLLLVPLTQIVAGGDLSSLPGGWVHTVANLPLTVLLGGFVVLVALRAGILFRVRMAQTALGLRLTRALRTRLQRAVMGADWRWLSGERSGDYGALVLGQAERLGSLAQQAIAFVTALITIGVLLATAVWLAWDMTLVTLALASMFVCLSLVMRKERDALGEDFADAYASLQRHLADGFAHLRAARIAGAQDILQRDFDRATSALEQADLAYNRGAQRAALSLQVAIAAIMAIIVWLGLRVLALPLVLFVPVLAIFLRIAPLGTQLQQGGRAWTYCRPALDTLLATLAAARKAAEPVPVGEDLLGFERAIEFSAVTFRYSGRPDPVLSRFSRTIPHGAVVAVSGPSGSGKSTLGDLVSGLIAPDDGSITVDGVALSGEARIRWRRQVAYVEQTPYLIDGTISENLAWGHAEVPEDAMLAALRKASADFVLDLPDGLRTAVGERGRELSGGERQRLSLARALLRQPSLVILDEVTAALDARNESVVAETIAAQRGAVTFIILGHRPALQAIADMRIDLGRDG